jgi:Na+/proline symporter
MIFCAGMSSTSAELSALATTSTVDILRGQRTEASAVFATKIATVFFGVLALGFAALFSLFENLIQAVNILGSLFYGTILGIFLVAFFVRHVQGTAVFIAALFAQATIFLLHFAKEEIGLLVYGKQHFREFEIAFLWYNLIAPAIVVLLAILIQALIPRERAPT